MIVTTTNTIEGRTIIKYLDPISSNVVVGSNVLSDIGASFVDFFGGRAENYERKLQDIYKKAIESLKNQAKFYNADAILGLSIDIDEISGKGTQMFMVTAVGTPVRLNKVILSEEKEISDGTVDGELVTKKLKASQIIDEYVNAAAISNVNAEFIASSKLEEVAHLVLNAMKEDPGLDIQWKERLNILFSYFNYIDPAKATSILYKSLIQEELSDLQTTRVVGVVRTLNLLDYQKARLLLDKSFVSKKISLRVFFEEKSSYLDRDIEILQQLSGSNLLSFFKEDVEIVSSKGLFSGSKDVWRCECGYSNKLDASSCSSCNRDKRGFKATDLTPEKIQAIINKRLEVIAELRSSQ